MEKVRCECGKKGPIDTMTYHDGMYTCKKCHSHQNELIKEAESLIMTDGQPIDWDDVHDGIHAVYMEFGTEHTSFDDIALLYAVFNMGRRFENQQNKPCSKPNA